MPTPDLRASSGRGVKSGSSDSGDLPLLSIREKIYEAEGVRRLIVLYLLMLPNAGNSCSAPERNISRYNQYFEKPEKSDSSKSIRIIYTTEV
jgi:hypothetical protein